MRRLAALFAVLAVATATLVVVTGTVDTPIAHTPRAEALSFIGDWPCTPETEDFDAYDQDFNYYVCVCVRDPDNPFDDELTACSFVLYLHWWELDSRPAPETPDLGAPEYGPPVDEPVYETPAYDEPIYEVPYNEPVEGEPFVPWLDDEGGDPTIDFTPVEEIPYYEPVIVDEEPTIAILIAVTDPVVVYPNDDQCAVMTDSYGLECGPFLVPPDEQWVSEHWGEFYDRWYPDPWYGWVVLL